MFILLAVFLLTSLAFYNFVWKRRNLPPGPTPWPLIGNGFTMKRLSPGYEAFEQWSKQYGPVFTYWFAEDPYVMVTDYNVMKEAFVNNSDATSGRDFFEKAFETFEHTKGNYGITRAEGERWATLRRFALKVFRNLGMGRNMMEEKIFLEVNTMIETISKDLDKNNMCLDNYHLSLLINVAIGSMINQLLFGFRFIGERRQDFLKLKSLINEQIKLLVDPATTIILSMPWLRHFPIFSQYFNIFKDSVANLDVYFKSQIEATMQKRSQEIKSANLNEEDTYFVKAFVQEMEQSDLNSDNQEDKFFNLPALKGLCMDLFFAGQETTSYTLQFIFLYMIVFPEVQTKMQEELDKEIGDNEEGTKRVTLADRAKLPYTNAVICESQRLCNLVPMNIPHRATKDVEIGSFKIAKGTVIVPNIANLLYDDKIFPEPHKFMPERFLENEQLKRIEEFIPFGIGKRQCMGESLARAELFLFTTNLFYLFKISAVSPKKPPSLKKHPGLSVSPEKYTCRVERRKQF